MQIKTHVVFGINIKQQIVLYFLSIARFRVYIILFALSYIGIMDVHTYS